MNESTLAPLFSPASAPLGRRLVASAAFAGLAGMVVALAPGGAIPWAMTLSLGLAAWAVQSRNLFAQAFAAAIAWTGLLLSALVCVARRVQIDPWIIVLVTSAVPLLAMGRAGLFDESARSQFAPLAARDAFVASSVLALVAAGGLLLVGMVGLEHHGSLALAGIPLALLGALGVAGMLRMRAWGLLATATAGGTSLLLALALQVRSLGVPYYDHGVVSGLFFFGGAGTLSVLAALVVARRLSASGAGPQLVRAPVPLLDASAALSHAERG